MVKVNLNEVVVFEQQSKSSGEPAALPIRGEGRRECTGSGTGGSLRHSKVTSVTGTERGKDSQKMRSRVARTWVM